MDIAQALAEAAAASIPPSSDDTPEAPVATDDAAAVRDDAILEDTTDADVAEAVKAANPDAAPAEESAPEAEEDAAAPALPEGYTAPAVLTEGLATEFTLLDAEGEIEIPAVTVKYKANGKIREDRLDQVVKLAQFGVYNQERDERAKAAEALAPERDALKATLAEREAQLERAITDPTFLAALQDAYEREMSPEAETKRAKEEAKTAKEEVETLRVQQQMEKIQEVGQQFNDTEVMPAIEMIAKACPTVTVEELEAKLSMALQAHAEEAPNGEPYVPPSRYEAIRQYIVDDLAVWAKAHHQRRATPAPPAQPAAKAQPDPKVADQQAKRTVGQITKPVGTSANAPERPKASAAPATIDDAMSSAMESVLASVR